MPTNTEPIANGPLADNPQFQATKAKMETRQRERQRAVAEAKRPIDALAAMGTPSATEPTLPQPEGIDIKERSKWISEEIAKNQPPRASAEAVSQPEAPTKQPTKLTSAEMDALMPKAKENLPPVGPLSTEGQIRSEVSKLRRNQTALVNPDSDPSVKEAVMNSILGESEPVIPPFIAPKENTPPAAEVKATAQPENIDIKAKSEEISRRIYEAQHPQASQEDSSAPRQETPQLVTEKAPPSPNAERAARSISNNLRLWTDGSKATGTFTRENGRTILTAKGQEIAGRVGLLISRETPTYQDVKEAAAIARKDIQKQINVERAKTRKQAEAFAKAMGGNVDRATIQKAAREMAISNTPEQTAQLAIINAISTSKLSEERAIKSAERQSQILAASKDVTDEQLAEYKNSLEAQGIKVRRPSDLKEKYARDIVAGRYIDFQTQDVVQEEPQEDKKPIDINSRRKTTRRAAIAAAAAAASIIGGGSLVGHFDGGNADLSPATPTEHVLNLPAEDIPGSKLPEGITIDAPKAAKVASSEGEKTIQGVVQPEEGLTQIISRVEGVDPESPQLWNSTLRLAEQNRTLWEAENSAFYAELDKLTAEGKTLSPDEIKQLFFRTGGENYNFTIHPDQGFTLTQQSEAQGNLG